MELEHTFTVPVGVDDAFRILRDIERIAPCMPGATIESVDGDDFTGRVKVKVGPMQVTYQGTASFVEVDEADHLATITARARETRGAGTANATIRASCTAHGEETEVRVVTDLAVTGKPAQFGRGVLADVGEKLLGTFAACLAEELADGQEPVLEDRAPDAGVDAEGTPPVTAGELGAPAVSAAVGGEVGSAVGSEIGSEALQRRTDETIDLLRVAGGPVARRAVPAAGLLALVALLVWLAGRRR